MRKLICLCAVLLAITCVAGSAAIIEVPEAVAFNLSIIGGQAPAGEVIPCDTSQDVLGGSSVGGYQVANNSVAIYRGGKFLAGDNYDVCKVVLPLRRTTDTAQAQTIKASIWSTDGGSPPVPVAIIGQESDTSIVRDDDLTTSFANITFEWTSATKASLTNGVYYWIVLHLTAGTVDSTDHIEWEYTGTGTGAGSDEDIANADTTPTWSSTTSFSSLLGTTYK